MKTKETGRYLKQLTGCNVFLACAGYLIFEQDLNSFYETGKLNLAVECRGDAIQLPHYKVVCYVAKIPSRCVQQDQPDCVMIRMVKNASVCTEKPKQTLK